MRSARENNKTPFLTNELNVHEKCFFFIYFKSFSIKDLEKMNNIILHNYQLNQLNHTMSDKLYGLNKKKYGNPKKIILNDKNTSKSNERLLDSENKKRLIFNNYSVNHRHKSKKISYMLSRIFFFQLSY